MKLLTDEQTNGGKKHKLLGGGNHIIFTQNNDNVCEKNKSVKNGGLIVTKLKFHTK